MRSNIRHSVQQALTCDVNRRSFMLRSGAITGLAFLLPALTSFEAEGQSATLDFYIGPNGRDDNPGTQSQPWSITALNTKRATYAGKRVGLLDGNYNLRSAFSAYPDSFASIILDVASGTAASPTVVRSVTPLGAVLDAGFSTVTQSPYPECSVIGCMNGGNVVIDALKIVNAGYRGIMIAGGSGYQIRNCYVLNQVYRDPAGPKGANSCGISLLTAVSGAIVSNCRVEGSGAPSDANRHACIQTFDTVDSVIEYCSVIGSANGGNGIHFKNTGNKRNTVRNCYIDMSATGKVSSGVLWHGNTSSDGTESFHNNIVKAGFIFNSEGYANHLSVRNNSGIAIPDFDTVGWYLREGGTLDFYNNVTFRSSAIYHGDVSVSSIPLLRVMGYNCYGDSSPDTLFTTATGQGYTGLAAFYAATGKDNPATSIVTNAPGFVATGAEAAYFQLNANAACKGAGRTTGTSSGAPIDMGAWGGATHVGCSFGAAGFELRSMPPNMISVS